jgi:hypothetical protein
MGINLKKHLDEYYDCLIGFKHSASRLDNVLQKDIEKYNSEESSLTLSSLQIVKDWSGLTDNGWAYTYPTDSFIQTRKEHYSKYINEVLSNQFCHLYVQSFEGLERLLKNILFELKDDIEITELIKSKLKQNQKNERVKLPSGDNLFDIIKSIILDFEFNKEELNFDWKTSVFILSKTRNGIIHKNSNFAKSEIFCSTDKKNLLIDLFKYEEINNYTIKLSLDLNRFKNLIDFMCDFAFQIFKKICIAQEIDWRIYKNMNKH